MPRRTSLAILAWCAFALPGQAAETIPSLVGTWRGKVNTISNKRGLKTRDRTVHITEQTDRRFRGYFDYEDGHRDFFGVILPDNTSFAWVSEQSKGQVQGRILDAQNIAACYIESGSADATAGCAELVRQSDKP